MKYLVCLFAPLASCVVIAQTATVSGSASDSKGSNSSDATAYNNRGSAQYYLNDNRGACADWRKASDLGYSPACNEVNTDCK